MELYPFDASYIESLRAGDRATEDHFVAYFSQLLRIKLRARLYSTQALDDVRQETFARVLSAIRKPGSVRQPERLGAFVNAVCNNVLLEHYRQSSRADSLDEEGCLEPVDSRPSTHDTVAVIQMQTKVRRILLDLPLRDRSLIKAVFLDERERDEVCREYGVDQDYLRVLLYRAKRVFKAAYVKASGREQSASFAIRMKSKPGDSESAQRASQHHPDH